MKSLRLVSRGEAISVLCLGAHADDIEIGAGGTILSWIELGVELHVHWCVLSASGPRAAEADASATNFLHGAASARTEFCEFRDGFFPYQGSDIKTWMEGLKYRVSPDIIFTHRRDDAHQDHRETSELTLSTFRDHLILEYEIPKWDGDFGRPNLYWALTDHILKRKLELLLDAFGSQRSKDWFRPDVFQALARLRGMECRAPHSYAEGFVARKLSLDTGV
jgi:LmbE family N-acetylglucosaminyl deacetylase